MIKPESRLIGYWPHLFLFNLCLILLQPEVAFNFLFFLPGYLLPLHFVGEKCLLYLWLGWAYFSALFSPEFPSSLWALGQEFVFATAGFYAGLYGRQEHRWVWVLIFTGFLMVGLIFIQAVAAPPFPPGWAGPVERALLPFRATGLWKNPNRTGLFLAFLLPIMVSFLEGGDSFPRRPFLPGALLVMTVPALMFTYSRTAWAAALASLVFYWGSWQKRKLLRLCCVGLLLFGLFPSVAGRIGRNPFHSATMLYRYRIWQETWRLVQKYPLTGGGGGALRLALRPLRADHAHNHFLQLAAEKGLPALLLFAGLVYWLFRKPLRSGDRGEDRRLQRGVQGAIVGQLVAGLTESLWVVPLDVFFFWFGLAFVTARRRRMTSEEQGLFLKDGGGGA